jgi:hypothetical protein
MVRKESWVAAHQDGQRRPLYLLQSQTWFRQVRRPAVGPWSEEKAKERRVQGSTRFDVGGFEGNYCRQCVREHMSSGRRGERDAGKKATVEATASEAARKSPLRWSMMTAWVGAVQRCIPMRERLAEAELWHMMTLNPNHDGELHFKVAGPCHAPVPLCRSGPVASIYLY